MADLRGWLYRQLTGWPGLTTLLPAGAAGVMAFRSFHTAPEVRPFVVIRCSTSQPAITDGGRAVAMTTSGQVWVHDWPGSFAAIDEAIAQIKLALEAGAAADGVICADWQGTNEDSEDPELGTIFKWCGVRLAHSA